jgi:hypothetical protein
MTQIDLPFSKEMAMADEQLKRWIDILKPLANEVDVQVPV